MTRSLVERLRNIDACAVSDAVDSLGLPPAVSGLRQVAGSGVLAGVVSTVTLEDGPAPSGAPNVHLGARAIEGGGPETVIVVSHPGIDCGGWGGVLSTAAQVAGIAGTIVDGPCRDAAEAHEMGYPVFARATTARTARGRLHERATGAPIDVDGHRVVAGDYVIADGSGVVFIPAGAASEVVGVAERIAAKEALMAAAVRAGRPVTQVMGADYEDMLDRGERGPAD